MPAPPNRWLFPEPEPKCLPMSLTPASCQAARAAGVAAGTGEESRSAVMPVPAMPRMWHCLPILIYLKAVISEGKRGHGAEGRELQGCEGQTAGWGGQCSPGASGCCSVSSVGAVLAGAAEGTCGFMRSPSVMGEIPWAGCKPALLYTDLCLHEKCYSVVFLNLGCGFFLLLFYALICRYLQDCREMSPSGRRLCAEHEGCSINVPSVCCSQVLWAPAHAGLCGVKNQGFAEVF